MPQEFHVLQCYSCQMFQVDIVKKVPKWSCKLCGEKQSVKKIFGTGTGKECRNLVQSLNSNLISNKTQKEFVSGNLSSESEIKRIVPTGSKWDEFIEDSEPQPSESQQTIDLDAEIRPKSSIFEDQADTNLNLEI